MLHSLYQFTNKGSFRTLSFILAIALTLCFFFNIHEFTLNFRSLSPLWILLILWACAALWIHGVGFEIRHIIWRSVFMPIVAEIIGVCALLYGLLF